MGSSEIQTSVIKTSTTEVYEKTSNILRAIEECGCSHCLSILKSGLSKPNPTDDETTNPVTSRIDHV